MGHTRTGQERLNPHKSTTVRRKRQHRHPDELGMLTVIIPFWAIDALRSLKAEFGINISDYAGELVVSGVVNAGVLTAGKKGR